MNEWSDEVEEEEEELYGEEEEGEEEEEEEDEDDDYTISSGEDTSSTDNGASHPTLPFVQRNEPEEDTQKELLSSGAGVRYWDPDSLSSITCFSCGEVGHLSKECPHPKVRPCHLCGVIHPEATECRLCINCNRVGHLAKACPYRRRKIHALCHNCGRIGHVAKECQEFPVTRSSRRLRDVRCLVCRKYGHLCCKAPRKKKAVFCFNCAQEGHFGDECDQPRMDQWTSPRRPRDRPRSRPHDTNHEPIALPKKRKTRRNEEGDERRRQRRTSTDRR